MIKYGVLPSTRVLPDWEYHHIHLITRWYRLRKLGRLYPIIQDGCLLWTFTNPVDPWGSRDLLEWDRLERDVVEAESVMITRKPMEVERGQTIRQQDVAALD